MSENPRLRLVFSTFPLCSQIPVVFYHSVIHGLGFFICYRLFIVTSIHLFFSIVGRNLVQFMATAGVD